MKDFRHVFETLSSQVPNCCAWLDAKSQKEMQKAPQKAAKSYYSCKNWKFFLLIPVT
jgi:hypothetical protein